MGTTAGQPAMAELAWPRPDSTSGRFYFWRRSAEHQLTSPAGRGAQVLVVAQN